MALSRDLQIAGEMSYDLGLGLQAAGEMSYDLDLRRQAAEWLCQENCRKRIALAEIGEYREQGRE